MLKYLFLFFIFVVSLLLAPTASAQMGMMGRPDDTIGTASADQPKVSLDEAITEILEFQGAGSVDEVDCENVTDSQFERLGDAWMESMHPGRAHENMDRVMGGEGSANLRAAHISMGQRYSGCLTDWGGRGWHPSMMGMMGGWGGYGGSMTSLWLFWLVSWVLVNILLIALIRYFWKKGNSVK